MAFHPDLYPYQILDAQWLAARNTALLAHEMGARKTPIAIAACDLVNAVNILVVCPAIARINWMREFSHFSTTASRPYHIIESTKDSIPNNGVILTSYDLAAEISPLRWPNFDVIVLDEEHYLKNIEAKRTQNILGKKGIIHEQLKRTKIQPYAQRNGSISQKDFQNSSTNRIRETSQNPSGEIEKEIRFAGRQVGEAKQRRHEKTKIWALTGTPCPNHFGELWPLLYTFGVTCLSFEDWVQRYCVVRESSFGRSISGSRETFKDEIAEILWGRSAARGEDGKGIINHRSESTGIALRRLKKEVWDEMPPLLFDDIVVKPSPVNLDEEASFVKYVFPVDRRAELELELKQQLDNVNTVVSQRNWDLLSGLAKSTSTLRRYIGLQKMPEIANLVANELDLKSYEKIVIFAIHRDVIEGLRKRLSDYGAVTLYGGHRFDSAQKNIDKFQKYGKFKVFIANITAAGTAINLSAASQVIFAEQDWVPGNNAQAAARCHRPGQKETVNVRFVGLEGSMDEKISSILRKKTKELTALFDGDKQKPT